MYEGTPAATSPAAERLKLNLAEGAGRTVCYLICERHVDGNGVWSPRKRRGFFPPYLQH